MDVLKKVVRRAPAVAVVLTETDAEGFPAESDVKGACEQFDISVARVAGQEVATAQFGIDALPALGMTQPLYRVTIRVCI